MIRVVAILLLLTASLSAQTFLGSVGVGQTVPDPFFPGGAPGAAVLSGFFCPGGPLAGLNFSVSGLPLGYNTGPLVTQETIFFGIDAGLASLPGIPVLGGTIYLPLTPAFFTVNGGSSVFLGPAGVPCPGIVPFPGLPSPNPNGAAINLPVPPGLMGVFSIQGAVFDPALGRIFSTNALNISIP